jgi:hypothetical protein
MTRFQNVDEVYSVLFVDFDNIFTRLSELDPALARTFATNPQRWMRWLEGHALRMMYGDGVRRRILKRCCYLNPLKFQEFRPFFIRSAFQVVDCPPLTNFGKNSADIHLVMDCMDALSHATRFDEFIILSGDADFTPVLLRIQEHARRSLVLSVGYTSPAYAAACSWRIREDWFISQALEDPRPDDDERQGDRPPSDSRENRPSYSNGPSGSRSSAEFDRDSGEQHSHADKSSGIHLPAYKRVHLVESIKQLVEESQVPVPLPSVSQILQREQGAQADWYGAGTLRDLLEELDLTPIVFSPVGQGYVYDPSRHQAPGHDDMEAAFRRHSPELYEFASKINKLTELPLLTPAQYTALLSLLVEEVKTNGYSRAETPKNVEEQCEEEDLPISQAQIAFVVEAITKGGAALSSSSRWNSGFTVESLRAALIKSVVDMCRAADTELTDDDMDLMDEWLQSDE